jgi:hypothetical protein
VVSGAKGPCVHVTLLCRLLAEEQSLITVRTTQQAMILQLTDARGGSSSSFY